jgi:hypothetical protein
MKKLAFTSYRIFIYFFLMVTIILVACSKYKNSVQQDEALLRIQTSSGKSITNLNGATQLSGIGSFATTDECNAAAGQGASYILKMTGQLEGCHYVFIDNFDCSPSGTYREAGRELFVGTYNGQTGTFWTTYKFEAKYEGCNNGLPEGAEIFGRCQHPIVAGSGTGVFSGVTGRLDFKDDIAAGNFPYRGHLRF